MKKVMRLDEAIQRKILRNLDKADPNALFNKKYNKVTIDMSITGKEKLQKIYRQDFEYVFFKTRINRGTKISILGMRKEKNQKSSVALTGVVGYLWGWNCWTKINQLYSNRCNGINSIAINEEELNLLFERNKKFKGFKFDTWIGESFEETMYKDGITEYGIKSVNQRTIEKTTLYYSNGWYKMFEFDYCPYIEIFDPSKIFVVLDSKERNGKWKLIPAKGLLKWKYRLF